MGEGEERKPNPFPALKMKTGVSATKPRAPIKAGASLIKLIWHAIPAASGGSWPTFGGGGGGTSPDHLEDCHGAPGPLREGLGSHGFLDLGPDDGRMGWGKMKQERKPTPSSSSRGKRQLGSYIPA